MLCSWLGGYSNTLVGIVFIWSLIWTGHPGWPTHLAENWCLDYWLEYLNIDSSCVLCASYHGNWVPRMSILRELHRKCMAFYDLASKVPGVFLWHILLVKKITKTRPDSRGRWSEATSQWEWVKGIVAIFKRESGDSRVSSNYNGMNSRIIAVRV